MSDDRCCCGRVTGLTPGERSRINDQVHARLGDAKAFCGPWWRHEIQDGEAEIARLRAKVAKLEGRYAEALEALEPLAALGGPRDGICAAYHDLPSDTIIYKNSGKWITAGDVRRARRVCAALEAALAEEGKIDG